jgi:hypothetical protein
MNFTSKYLLAQLYEHQRQAALREKAMLAANTARAPTVSSTAPTRL